MRTHHTIHRLKRLPILWWSAVALLAITVGATVASFVAKADAAAQRYEGTVSVAIAQRNIPAGTRVEPVDFEIEDRPRAFLPNDPPIIDPVGSVSAIEIVEGEPIIASKVAPKGLGEVASMLRDGERAIAIARGDAPLRLERGDFVDVIGSFSAGSGETAVLTLAHHGRIIDLDDATITIAVATSEAPRVALASEQGKLALALSLP